jgi:hypothetical protein
MGNFSALFLAGVFLSVSCAGYKNVPQKTVAPAPDSRVRGMADLSLEEAYDGGYWITRPRNGTITILGIAGRRGNREEAVTEALADAARKAALYHGVYGESAAILNQGPGNLDYYSDFDYRLHLLNDSGNYAGKLAFDKNKDVLEKDGSVMVRTRYSGVTDIPVYETIMEDGAPAWVKDYAAEAPGFLVGVGYSKNMGSLQKTYRASYEHAIASLLPRLSSKVVNAVIDAEGGKASHSISAGSGVLEKVMILETWFDRKTRSLWTLVAAKEKAR